MTPTLTLDVSDINFACSPCCRPLCVNILGVADVFVWQPYIGVSCTVRLNMRYQAEQRVQCLSCVRTMRAKRQRRV